MATCRFVPGVAEMKRLYVRPAFREVKIGRNIAWLAMGMAGEVGYASIRLETVPNRMETADGMCRKLGFERVRVRKDRPANRLLQPHAGRPDRVIPRIDNCRKNRVGCGAGRPDTGRTKVALKDDQRRRRM